LIGSAVSTFLIAIDLVLLGVALTQHCNLRCPHCIRDDVGTVRSIDPGLVLRLADEARELFGDVTMSFTGGEPTLHPQWDEIMAGLVARDVPYRFVSNGWHMRRLMPSIDRWPPAYVRLSLSGASAETHDAERGRDSFRRVLMAVMLLTSRRIPTALSIVIDRRDRHEVRVAADLAESLGCVRLHYILPQPVPGSIIRDSDLAPHEWASVQREVRALVDEPERRTIIQLDYGAPAMPGDDAVLCDTMMFRRMYVDAHGRVSLCCQLSEYGFGESDVVGDLRDETLGDVWTRYQIGVDDLRQRSAPENFSGTLAEFPCMRCAHALGKLEWLAASPSTAWGALAAGE
jgi:MoaA/NifB/PqqE/SkfB family radical SAM enzyme